MAERVRGEVRTLTSGVAGRRAGGLGFAETVGMEGAADVLNAVAGGTPTDRGLHADGETCARCGDTFGPDTPVRRRATGDYVHDCCPG